MLNDFEINKQIAPDRGSVANYGDKNIFTCEIFLTSVHTL